MKKGTRKEKIWGRENLINLYEIWEQPKTDELEVGLRVLFILFIVIGEKSLGFKRGELRKRDEKIGEILKEEKNSLIKPWAISWGRVAGPDKKLIEGRKLFLQGFVHQD